jgi:hypothetical protein
MLGLLFGAPTPVAVAVRDELVRHASQTTFPEKRDAASVFQGRGQSMLEIFGVPTTHTHHVEAARQKLALAAQLAFDTNSTKDLGEAESIVLCINYQLPLICQDEPATRVAISSGLKVHSTVVLLAELIEFDFSATQLHKMAMDMHDRVGIGRQGVPPKSFFDGPRIATAVDPASDPPEDRVSEDAE